VEPDAISVPAAAGGVERSVRAATGDSDFVPGIGLDYIFMALAPSLRWLFVGRLISGITASNVSTAFAYIADVTPGPERAKKFGYWARRLEWDL